MNTVPIQEPMETRVSDPFAELRLRCREIMAQDRVSQTQMGRQLGVAPQTFSAWLNDAYAGDNAGIAERVRIGLDSMEARARATSILPPEVGFLETPTAARIVTHLQFAHFAPAIVVVAAGAGVGKTMTARHYRNRYANVWLATAEPCTATVYPMLNAVADAMGIEERVQTRLSAAIRKFVDGKGGLLIVDEAQHLEAKALDQLRSISDAVDLGIALMGNERVYSRLEGGGRRAEFAQLFSRVGRTMSQARPRSDDARTIMDAWRIRGTDSRKLCEQIARRPGALRALSMTLRSAAMSAGGAEKIAYDHIRAAFEDLSHQAIEASE